MKTLRFLAAAVIAVAVTFASATAGVHESHIYTHNQTADAWVWVTAHEVDSRATWFNKGAWCVAPGKDDQHALRANIQRVRFEVTNRAGCLHPVVLNVYDNFPSGLNVMNYYVTKSGSHYEARSR